MKSLMLVAMASALMSASAMGAESRTWKDATGKFSVQATLFYHDASQVVLEKSDGKTVTVPLSKLSAADRAYLQELDAKKPAPAWDHGERKMHRVRIGMEFMGVGNATGIVGIVPVPINWPEQSVKLIDQQKTSNVSKISFRDLEDGARQMMIHIPRLRRGETASAVVTYEVLRFSIIGPEETDSIRRVPRFSRDLRHYLLPGPLTNAKAPNIIAAKDKAIAGVQGDWNQVRAIHGWVLDHVRYQERPQIKSASVALDEGVGDCQELSSLFVAMCRAHGVPARCVWIPGHSYAEFYMDDADGRGYWFPVESTNKEQFGFIPRTDVVLQKGDNFKLPEFREPLHYARTIFKAADIQGGQPEFKEIREIVPMDDPGQTRQ